jgi:predicted Zn-ribbon and HTH transcriptional regulator
MDISEIEVFEVEHQCYQCGVITDHVVNDEPCCPECEKELLEEGNA